MICTLKNKENVQYIDIYLIFLGLDWTIIYNCKIVLWCRRNTPTVIEKEGSNKLKKTTHRPKKLLMLKIGETLANMLSFQTATQHFLHFSLGVGVVLGANGPASLRLYKLCRRYSAGHFWQNYQLSQRVVSFWIALFFP